jgi:hypothetical protein
MILGDSCRSWRRLAEREGLRGKVQCIYFDPPYGIKFNSNFQWSTTSRDVKDGNADHITREPEQVKAFRDTWRDGIHSYLTYLRDRLTVARDLLTDSGSILMATDPGDLVLDPTCGSGTTAYVAEQWGRRWITIDTSRVALALARARIMGARYPYYLLADSAARASSRKPKSPAPRRVRSPVHGNIRHGFVYERVPHITLKSIANNAEIDVIWEKWQEKLEPLREKLNAALGKNWEEWEIPARGRRSQVAADGEEAARRLVGAAHRPAEGDRRLHRRQGRLRVPLRQALRGQEEGPRGRAVHGREPRPTACWAWTRTTN